jgi:PAS domain S-box-containing protein
MGAGALVLALLASWTLLATWHHEADSEFETAARAWIGTATAAAIAMAGGAEPADAVRTLAQLALPDGHAREFDAVRARVLAAAADGDGLATAQALRTLLVHAESLGDQGLAWRLDANHGVEILLATGALAAAVVLGVTALAMRRQRGVLRHALRRATSDLGRGDWHDALRPLGDARLGAPSAFDALAAGVEDILGTSERRWCTLAELAADWYWETDDAHRLAWMSGSGPLAALPGMTVDALIGRRHDEIPALEPAGGDWSRLTHAMQGQRAFRDMGFSVRLPGGDERWLAISGRPRVDATGAFAGYEGVGRDDTERRRAHDALRASDQRWALMAGLASDYYFETDAEHRLLPLRSELARRFGPLAEHAEGLRPWEAFPHAMTPADWDAFRRDIAERRPYRDVELTIDLPGGGQRIVAISGVPRFDGAGRFVGYHGVGRDQTLRREAERLLMRHNEALQCAVAERTAELERVNRDLEAFARELAHELRTPIGHVQGLAHLLVSKAGDRLVAEDLELVELQLGAARHMRQTVDGLLMLARSANESLHFDIVDLSALAAEVAAALPPLARREPIAWEIEPGLFAWASEPAMRIVLTNLLGNAAKFTRHVETPRVRVGGRVDDAGRLRLSVQDNGAGFDPARVDRLFKPFARLHAEQDYQGTGIGLTIVARLVERHGGRVAARGEQGQGACFEFTVAAHGARPAAGP